MDKPVYIGLDIGKFTFSCSAPNRKPRDFTSNPAGVAAMLEFLATVAPPVELWFVMESTASYSAIMAGLLLKLADTRISIVPPICVTSFIKSKIKRTKNDRIDAQAIRNYAEVCQPPAWLPPSQTMQRLRDLFLVRESTIQTIVRKKCLLENFSHPSHPGGPAVEALKRSLAFEKAERDQLLEEIERVIADDATLCADSKNMLSVPHVGVAVRNMLMTHCLPQLKQLSQRKLLAYCGLCPQQNQSGRSKGQTRMNKAGDPVIRSKLYMSAINSVREEGLMRDYYLKQRANGKSGKSALVSVMRKILYLTQAVVKSGIPFDRDMYLNPA